jgi:hypothetical protein
VLFLKTTLDDLFLDFWISDLCFYMLPFVDVDFVFGLVFVDLVFVFGLAFVDLDFVFGLAFVSLEIPFQVTSG